MPGIDYETEYRKLYQDKPLEDIIIFRSGPMPESYIPGMDFDDNARALFEYALSINLQKKSAKASTFHASFGSSLPPNPGKSNCTTL